VILILGAVLLGLVIGLATGGSVKDLASVRFRWWGLVFLGLGLQLVPVPSRPGDNDHVVGVALLVGSYVALLVFVVANLRLPGFWLLAAGFACNLVLVAVNGGMPVSAGALRRAAGSNYSAMVASLRTERGARHHLVRPDDDLVALADVIPMRWPGPQVLSVGDVVWLLGTVWLVAGATHGKAGRGTTTPKQPEPLEGPSPFPPPSTRRVEE